MDKEEIIKLIQKAIDSSKSYIKTKQINVRGKDYTLHIFYEEEKANLYEGIVPIEFKDKDEFNYWRSLDPYKEGWAYTPRLIIGVYNNKLLIKDPLNNKKLIRRMDRINESFIKKLKKALANPNEENFNKLFDRKDVIEEFYQLYRKSREYLLKNIKGISDEEKRREFVDNLMMQMLTLWYLQEKGFFNRDKNYFVNKFEELKQKKLKNSFDSFYDFLRYFFEKISKEEGKQYLVDSHLGKVVVIGPAVFLNGDIESKGIKIPDKCFYKKGLTQKLIELPPKKVNFDVPLLNLFESRDWVEGNVDEYVLGAIYEKLINYDERKKTGAYYTPEEITSYICENTIKPYLLDKMNEKFKTNWKTIDEVIENADKEQLRYLFDLLREIKIVDPAVGSAHFLESAIKVLLDIYENIWRKARELNIKGFRIKTSDEKGELKEIDLLEIKNEEKFRLYIKFFIILSRNIYGVDINGSALKVAKARLFLNLAKHFKVGEKEMFIRFPNVHFNLREGNSLIGYVTLEKKKRNSTIWDFFGVSERVEKKIKGVKELEDYLVKISEKLDFEGNIIKELDELNEILAKDNLLWEDFEKVLKIKGKLVKILIVSLSSKYAKAINELLNEINKEFNEKLDEKFAREHGVNLEDLKKIKTFHWIFEFPEVFLRENSGFDVVVGNPPYGNTLGNIEKKICEKYASYLGEIASVFVERSTPLNRKSGYFSFIITYAITFSKDLSETREIIFRNYDECFISTFDRDRCRFFDSMTQSVSIMLCKRKMKNAKCRFYTSKMHRIMPRINEIKFQYANNYLLGDKIGASFYEKHRVPKIGEEVTLKILGKIAENKNVVRDIISTSGKKIWIRTSGNYWYNAWEKKPYDSTEIKPIFVKEDWKDFIILLMNSSLFYWWFRIYGDGRHMNFDIMGALPIPPEEKIKKVKGILSTISHLLMAFLFYNFDEKHNRFITSNVKPIIDLGDILLGKLCGLCEDEIEFILNYEKVIRGGKKIPHIFYRFIDYLLFSHDLTKSYFMKLMKVLIYELYFKEKFYEDGLYPEPKEYLLEAISKHLKPINYDRWAESYWKQQLKEELNRNEERELGRLTKENMKTIEEVYEKLKADKEVVKWIEKIKSHEWVKIIENHNKRPKN